MAPSGGTDAPQGEMPVTDMGEMVGSVGFFKDTEGNRYGVHKSRA